MGQLSYLYPSLVLPMLLGLATLLAVAAGRESGGLQTAAAELASMHRLRQALYAADALRLTELAAGWQPGDPAHPCDWPHIKCNAERRVHSISLLDKGVSTKVVPTIAVNSTAAGPRAAPALQLPPELAQLEWLAYFTLALSIVPLQGGLPREWGLPGAFPRLQRLAVATTDMRLPLLDILPGALIQLRELFIQGDAWQASLPATWGGTDVLPALMSLSILMPGVEELPSSWAQGFRRLETLAVCGAFTEGGHMMDGSLCIPRKLNGTRGGLLPPNYAKGFPSLRTLHLACLPHFAPFPPEWANGFPALTTLNLLLLGLTGTLPVQLLQRHPHLQQLWLDMNRLSGTLPKALGGAELTSLSLAGNAFTGPALPPTVFYPGAFVRLRTLYLGSNPGLTGTLPSSLPLPSLRQLDLSGTGVHGRVPDSWCSTPLAHSLSDISVNGSKVDPELPRCLAESMQQAAGRQPYSSGGGELSGRQRSGAHSTSLAAVFVLAALAVAGVAGRVLLHGRQRRHGTDTWCRTVSSLLLTPQSGNSKADSSRLLTRSHPAGTGDGNLQARLAALVSAELGGSQGSIEVLPLEAMPVALMHQLGAWPGCTQPADASTAAQLCPGAVAASDLQGAHFTSRLWRLDTRSLHIAPAHLAIVSDARGPVSLGHGATAMVVLGRLQGSTDVAVKAIELPAGVDSRTAWREVSLLRRCPHRRIVPLLGVALKGRLFLLVMALMRGGSLHAALADAQGKDALRWEAGGRQLALDVAEALAFLHEENVMHSDLKSSNVLLDSDLRACVGDLGIAQALCSRARTAMGLSFCYAAPEQLLGQRCSLAVDVYSLGVLLAELTTQTVVRRRGGWRLPRSPEECPHAVLEIIQRCTLNDPAARPTASEVLHVLRATGGSCA